MSRDGLASEPTKVRIDPRVVPGGRNCTDPRRVSTRTGLPRSTTHRLLVDLSNLGWLKRTNNTFDLGMALFELGEQGPVKHRLRAAAMPFKQDLYAVTGQTVHLAVHDRAEAIYIEKMSLPLPSQIGGRMPLTCTAVGKALLAFEPARP